MALNDPGLQSLSSIAASEFYDVTITDTNSPIEQGDTLVIDYEVDNTGDKTGTQDITLEIEDVLEDTDAGVRVLANRTDSGTLEWVTDSDETAQDYTATVLSADESAAQTVTVEDAEAEIPDSAVHHYDATTLSLADNDPVSTWGDEIGDNDLQATGSPTYLDDELNDNPVVRYDGTDDYHDNDIIDLTQPYAIIWVVRDVAGDSDRMLSGMDSLVGDNENILSNDESGSRGMFAGSFISGGSSDTNWNIWNAYFNTTDSDLRINASTIATGDVGDQNIGEYRVGANRGVERFMEIDVAEMVVLNDPTADDRDSEDQRLSNKWGIDI